MGQAYLTLVTSEHADKPRFSSTLVATCQPFEDIAATLLKVPELYDVDIAIGDQLDVCGQWVGVSRLLDVALTGVYFSFDIDSVGFDQGVWQGLYDPTTGLVSLPDDFYRAVIKMRILNNHWDGTKESAYSLMKVVFDIFGYSIYIEDHSDQTMAIGFIGQAAPTPILTALIKSGKFDVKPAGIRISQYVVQSVPGPIFGFDINNSLLAGFDTGGWGIPL